ncbi:hypothetical protein EVAR_40140_1 [Eumeta japonica]|uniref:Uncharacterized protein n=1 Tax=Eumeta variegata TaxID=151549 RepID=A0A4C1WBQ4_EUMVA|nr:hypothetical protein EVAR_40140_1 [Eumeta japonica]
MVGNRSALKSRVSAVDDARRFFPVPAPASSSLHDAALRQERGGWLGEQQRRGPGGAGRRRQGHGRRAAAARGPDHGQRQRRVKVPAANVTRLNTPRNGLEGWLRC